MFLEKLEISGFKSFANKNKLIFSGILEDQRKGLTAIVGPNGSGKSNTADAIRWVLGEQSAKTLRGKKGEDVIFSGSDKKARLGMAEVSLYLNNQDKLIKPKIQTNEENEDSENDESNSGDKLKDIIENCDEISITRRLYRNGDSEYLINGTRSRLSDISMLLAKANFGQKTYSVIGQGMVENFLTASASERKDFFDEATGIKQFQIKRDSSINKLESSYENLQQVDMLLTEVKPRLKSLTRQVEKLKKRESLEIDLKENQLNYYSLLWHDINNKFTFANNEFLKIEKEKIEKENKLNKLNEELNKLRSADNYNKINELEPELKEKEYRKNNILKQIAKLQAELEAKLEAQGQYDVSWLSNKQSQLKKELETIKSEISSLEKNDKHQEEILLNENITELNKSLVKNNNIFREINSLKNIKETEERKITKAQTIIETNIEIKKRFDVNKLKEKETNYLNTISALDSSINDLSQEKSLKTKTDLEGKLNNINNEIKKLNNNLNTLKIRLENQKDELGNKEEIEKLIDDFLNRLDEINKENNISLVKKLIAEAKNSFKIKIKTLITGENLEDLEEFRQIQEDIIKYNEDKQKINYKLNDENLRLERLNEKEKACLEKKTEIYNFLNDIKADLEQANSDFNQSELENNIRDFQKAIKISEEKILDLKKQINKDEVNSKIKIEENKLQNWKIENSTRLERIRLLKNKLSSIINEIEDIENKIKKSEIKFDAQAIKQEEFELKEQISLVDLEIDKIVEKINILNEARNEEKTQLFEIQKNAQTIQNDLNNLSNKLNSLQIEITRQETRLEDLENNIRLEELNVSQIENNDKELNNIDKDSLFKTINNIKNQLELIGGIDPEVETEYNDTKKRYDFLSEQTNDLDKAINSLEEIINELDKTIKKRFDSEFKVISEKFSEYFKVLFNGGTAKISKILGNENENDEKIIEENDENSGFTKEELKIKNEINNKLRKLKKLKKQNGANLEGVEIQAIPPGKKIQTVTMLSGGERALTAIALICAIISANPSPFVVLDEVDAALDESNSERLAKILDDLSNKTQFIVITHNRASMKKASILYGVTMQADGVSKLLSVKLDDIKTK